MKYSASYRYVSIKLETFWFDKNEKQIFPRRSKQKIAPNWVMDTKIL